MRDRSMGDADPTWVPSRPSFRVDEAPWNTVGLPEPGNVVQRAIQQIESRLTEKRSYEPISHDSLDSPKLREDEIPNSTEVARTRLLWQAREKGNEPIKPSVEYRTDYFPTKDEPGENILILKLEEVPSVPKKDVTVQTTNVETIETIKVHSYFNYEKSWRDFRYTTLWNPNSGRLGTVNSSKVSSVVSHIPRARKCRICKVCHKVILGDRTCCEGCAIRSESIQRFQSMDPQRSRTNFFGNSGSYALRCNLFAVPQKPQRKFYLTPDPDRYEKKVETGEDFEPFQAKKKVFYRQRVSSTVEGLNYTQMW